MVKPRLAQPGLHAVTRHAHGVHHLGDAWRNGGGAWAMLVGLSVWAQASTPSLERLEALQYVRLLGSLILLTLGGVSLVVLAWLALQVGRRHSKRQDAKLEKLGYRVNADDWVAPPPKSPNDMNRR